MLTANKILLLTNNLAQILVFILILSWELHLSQD